MKVIPEELFENICTSIGNAIFLSGVPKNRFPSLIENMMKTWELYNENSEMYQEIKDYINKGYDDMNEYSKNIVIFPDKTWKQ